MIFNIYNRFKKGVKNLIEEIEKDWERYKYVASKVADEYLGKLVRNMLEEMQASMDLDSELNRQIQETKNKLKELIAKREARKC